MRPKGFIRLNDELALELGLHEWVYDSLLCWDLTPKCIDITDIRVKECVDERWVLEDLFDKLANWYWPTRFTAPRPIIKEIALERGWEFGTQPEGTTYVTNLKLFANKQPEQEQDTQTKKSDCPAFLVGVDLDKLFL